MKKREDEMLEECETAGEKERRSNGVEQRRERWRIGRNAL